MSGPHASGQIDKSPPDRPAPNVGDNTPDIVTSTYCFSLNAGARQRLVGQVSGGYRVDLEYWGVGPSVGIRQDLTRQGLGTTASEILRNATVVSGNDWVFVSDGGVASFDSRVTLEVLANPRVLVGARIRGRSDLRTCKDSNDKRVLSATEQDEKVVDRWKTGFPDDSFLPLTVSVVFDVPLSVGLQTVSYQGMNREEAKKKNEIYSALRELERSLFIGLGRAVFKKSAYSDVQSIAIDVLRVEVPVGSPLNKPFAPSAEGAFG